MGQNDVATRESAGDSRLAATASLWQVGGDRETCKHSEEVLLHLQ